jgi:type IV pilus assembly protein PilO
MAASITNVTKATEESSGFLSRIAWYYQMLLLVALVALLIFATHALLYSDKWTEIDKTHEQIQSLKAKNAQGNIIRQNIADYERTLKEKQEEIEQLRDLLPDQVEISRVYSDIKDRMHSQKLELKRFAEMKTAPSDFYTAQPIQVEVTGTYDNLGHFFSQLAFYTRIVSVTEVEIKQAQDAGQEVGRSIDGQFTITAYYISPENLDKLTMKRPAAPTGGTGTTPAKPGQPPAQQPPRR